MLQLAHKNQIITNNLQRLERDSIINDHLAFKNMDKQGKLKIDSKDKFFDLKASAICCLDRHWDPEELQPTLEELVE